MFIFDGRQTVAVQAFRQSNKCVLTKASVVVNLSFYLFAVGEIHIFVQDLFYQC